MTIKIFRILKNIKFFTTNYLHISEMQHELLQHDIP